MLEGKEENDKSNKYSLPKVKSSQNNVKSKKNNTISE